MSGSWDSERDMTRRYLEEESEVSRPYGSRLLSFELDNELGLTLGRWVRGWRGSEGEWCTS